MLRCSADGSSRLPYVDMPSTSVSSPTGICARQFNAEVGLGLAENADAQRDSTRRHRNHTVRPVWFPGSTSVSGVSVLAKDMIARLQKDGSQGAQLVTAETHMHGSAACSTLCNAACSIQCFSPLHLHTLLDQAAAPSAAQHLCSGGRNRTTTSQSRSRDRNAGRADERRGVPKHAEAHHT